MSDTNQNSYSVEIDYQNDQVNYYDHSGNYIADTSELIGTGTLDFFQDFKNTTVGDYSKFGGRLLFLKASTLKAIAPIVKPTDDNASPIESIRLNDEEYIPFNTDLSDYQETNLLIDGDLKAKRCIQSLILNYIYKNKIFLFSWQKKLVFNYYNNKKIQKCEYLI